MRPQWLVLPKNFAEERGIESVSTKICEMKSAIESVALDAMRRSHDFDWWDSPIGSVNSLEGGQGRRHGLSDHAGDVVMAVFCRARPYMARPKGRNITPAMVARMMLDFWTEPEVQTDPDSPPETLLQEALPKQLEADLMRLPRMKPPQGDVTLRELRDEIRELHAMLRATLSDVETVRRDVGDVRSLVRGLLGIKAQGRPQ